MSKSTGKLGSNSKMLKAIGAITAFLVLVGASSCDPNTATSSAFCAYLFGNGQDGNDAAYRELLYPQQQIHKDNDEEDFYVPCNERTYITTNFPDKELGDEGTGDRNYPTYAQTSTKVPVIVTTSTSWRLGQSESAMRALFPFCEKFKCYSEESVSGDDNFSTPGWNGMLFEYMSPTIDRIVRQAVYEIFDSEDSLNDPIKIAEFEKRVSELFQDEIQSRTTTTEQLFCGGSSSWPNPDKPGEGDYQCDPVTIKVDLLEKDPDKTVSPNSEAALQSNQDRYANLEPLYGPYTNQAIMALDIVDACAESTTTCLVNIGDPGDGAQVPVPVTAPTPTQVPTEVPTEEG